jgi:hypothetical protein
MKIRTSIVAKILLSLLTSSLFFGCQKESLEYADNLSKIKEVEKIIEKFSPFTFSGVASLSYITDSSVNIYWPDHPHAVQYEIYRVENESIELLKTLERPASFFTITQLGRSKSHTFRVNLRDAQGLKDANTNDQIITTLEAPPETQCHNESVTGILSLFVQDTYYTRGRGKSRRYDQALLQ